MGDRPEEVSIPLQETGLCEHSIMCVGQTSGKVPYNTVTGVTVLMTQSVTHTIPSKLHIKVRHTHMHAYNWIVLLQLN